MTISPSELLSSLTKEYVNYVATKNPCAYDGDKPEINAANYIRIIKMAPTFLNFIKDSIYISTKKYSDDFIYTSATTTPYESTSDDCTYKILNDKDEIIDVTVGEEIIAKTRKMFNHISNPPESWGNISKSKIDCNTIENFFKAINSKQLETLKSVIQPDLVSAEEWESALSLTKKYKVTNDYVHTMSSNLESSNLNISKDDTIHDVVIAAQEIEKIVSDGDIVIFVGNTPQLIRYPLEKIITHTKPHVKAVSLAISGHPDQIKEQCTNGIIPNVLTTESHEAYKEYMQHMGITAEDVKDHKIHLIDCIGSGGGLVYLIRCITEIADAKGEAMPHIDLIALNEINWDFAKFSKETEYHNLKMDQLTKTLDRVSDNERLMPSANSYKWTPEFVIALNI
ncbi:hypothetical protein [Candidatus Tisiphia endosymbiont of Hybos culiciformis]|uniref:hypothetical protein n=1 Tax=Candidatus Tisiphia endosymbiont of Hybos culiciformis TaxID=3139331 RepID=UPI003CCB65DC